MLQFRRRFVGLCLVPIFLAALDGWVTLHGQSKEYWDGNHSQVNENTPIFHIFLSHGPLAFTTGLAVWVLAFVGMILLLPQTLALAMCLAITLGHTTGASSWIVYLQYGSQFSSALCVVTALGLAVGIRWGWRAEPPNDEPVGMRLHVGMRWLIIAALCGIEIFYLWPHKL